MGTVPVGQSIGGAYGFLFRRFFTILGLSWLPAAVYAFGRLGFLWHVEPGIFAAVHEREHPSPTVLLLALGFVLFSTLMKAAVALPLNRDALGLQDQPVLARLVIGAREFRLFAAYILIGIILIALLVASIFGVMGITIGTKWALAQWGAALAGWPVVKIVHLAAAVIAVLVFFFVALRLSFLIAPIAASEDKARLSRAWMLSAGNFWRMFAIFLALAVPLLIVIAACEYAVMGPEIMAIHRAMGARHDPSALLSVAIAHGPALVTIAAAGLVIAAALFAGAAATAYRALVPQPRRETEVYVEPVETQAYVAPKLEPVFENAPVEEAAPVAEEAATTEHEHVAEAVIEEAPHEEAHPEPESPVAEHQETEHHAEAAESSHEAIAPAEEPAMELHEPLAQEETHEAPPPEVPEDPGAHTH